MSQRIMNIPPESIPTELPSTPPHCIADFCLIPIGTSSPSVSSYIADVQRFLLAVSRQRSKVMARDRGTEIADLSISMHSAGTTMEGPWDVVMEAIGQAHSYIHQKGVLRIQTDIRVGTRTDKSQSVHDKIAAVNNLLEHPEAREEEEGPASSKQESTPDST